LSRKPNTTQWSATVSRKEEEGLSCHNLAIYLDLANLNAEKYRMIEPSEVLPDVNGMMIG
jgi:hypothetical protein